MRDGFIKAAQQFSPVMQEHPANLESEFNAVAFEEYKKKILEQRALYENALRNRMQNFIIPELAARGSILDSPLEIKKLPQVALEVQTSLQKRILRKKMEDAGYLVDPVILDRQEKIQALRAAQAAAIFDKSNLTTDDLINALSGSTDIAEIPGQSIEQVLGY